METYQYIDNQGQTKTISANSSNEALMQIRGINPSSGVMRVTAPTPTPVTQPTQPVQQPSTPVVGSVQYDNANNLPLGTSSSSSYKPVADLYGGDDVYNQLGESYRQQATQTLKTDEELMAEKTRMYQAEIDAVNKIYTDKIASARVQGQGRIGSSTASQARSGLLGSDFGASQTANVENQNREVEDAYRNEQNVQIQTILGKARSEALEEARAKREAKELGAKNYIEFLTGAEARKKERVTNLAKSLLAQGKDLSSFTDSELAELARSYGTTKESILATFRDEKMISDKAQADIEKAGMGTGTIGEYQFYAQQERLAGRTPKSFEEYQTEDANRKAKSTGLTPYQQFQATQSISKDNQARTENAREMARQSELIASSYNNIVNGGDRSLNTQAIITSFNKILDPTSVVRESEYDRTAQGQALLSRLRGKYDNIVAGGAGVTEATLKEAVDIANSYLASSKASIEAENQRAQAMAEQFGLNSSFVTNTYNSQGSGLTPTEQSTVDRMRADKIPDDIIEQVLGKKITFNQGGATVNAQRLAEAIKRAESGGNYNAVGDAGTSTGAYQFQASTWKQWAGEILGNPNAPMTKQNQDIVAIGKIDKLLSQGYNAEQIALIWNGGEPVRKKGFNSRIGLAYDSGAYADKVLSYL